MLRADRARRGVGPGRSRRGRSATAATGCSAARRSSSRSGRGRRWRSASRGPAAREHAASRASSCRRTRRASRRADQGQARACARRTPASCSSSAYVPDSARLGDEGDGFKVAMSALDNGRISLAGVRRDRARLPRRLRRGTRDRTQFDRPIARFQLVQELLADIAVETDAARLLTWRAAVLADAGERHARVVGRQVLRERVSTQRKRRRPGTRRLRLATSTSTPSASICGMPA